VPVAVTLLFTPAHAVAPTTPVAKPSHKNRNKNPRAFKLSFLEVNQKFSSGRTIAGEGVNL